METIEAILWCVLATWVMLGPLVANESDRNYLDLDGE